MRRRGACWAQAQCHDEPTRCPLSVSVSCLFPYVLGQSVRSLQLTCAPVARQARRCVSRGRGRQYRPSHHDMGSSQLDPSSGLRRLLCCRETSIFGTTAYFLQHPRRTTAICSVPGSVYCISRDSLEQMSQSHPAVYQAIQTAIIRALSRTLQVQYVGHTKQF